MLYLRPRGSFFEGMSPRVVVLGVMDLVEAPMVVTVMVVEDIAEGMALKIMEVTLTAPADKAALQEVFMMTGMPKGVQLGGAEHLGLAVDQMATGIDRFRSNLSRHQMQVELAKMYRCLFLDGWPTHLRTIILIFVSLVSMCAMSLKCVSQRTMCTL